LFKINVKNEVKLINNSSVDEFVRF